MMQAGLSSKEAAHLLGQYGANEIPEKHTHLSRKFLKKFLSPISWMLLAAALLSFFVRKYFDCSFISILLLANILITLWQENKADTAIKKLNESLSPTVKALRDGRWRDIGARLLVPADLVKLAIGDVIPADGRIVDGKNITINESALTGESLPQEKTINDLVYSGSFVTTGTATIAITATGKATSFGKTIASAEHIRKKSLLEADILSISKYLTLFSLIAVGLLSGVFILQRVSKIELITLDLSLLIAGVPISLPTVMTLIIEFGVLALAKKQAIVRRLSALEDLANIDLLLTDKTGTLTKNEIVISSMHTFGEFTNEDVLRYAALAAAKNDHDAIDLAIAKKAAEEHVTTQTYQVIDFVPADSIRKHSTTTIRDAATTKVIALGAPQIIANLCAMSKTTQQAFEQTVAQLAESGFRCLAIALSPTPTEKDMQLVGLLALSDTLRNDAKDVVDYLKTNGIQVAMVTGDNRAIASQIARELALDDGKVITKSEMNETLFETAGRNLFAGIGVFAEILPEDKLHLVQKAKQYFVVAATGDGINDLPALKAAHVGIAVKNAVAALKATADIVLVSDGIQVICDAILESRKIFERLYTYSLYRISESLRLIITIAVLGVLYRSYPLTALQLIVLALLNDIPIISLAFDRVKVTSQPAKIDAKKRLTLSSLYGLVGVGNSLILFFIIRNVLHLDWKTIQTVYFLKLTVSGHMLIYVAHTKERWWKFLPSKEVIWSTTLTQLVASLLALTGFLMPAHISFAAIIFIWIWSFFWMQMSELAKRWRQS